MVFLAIDQGTTNTKALLVARSGAILARASVPLATHYPQPGWAEQSALEIRSSVQAAIAEVARSDAQLDAIAIANQRETLVVWEAAISQPICPAILWQCRRTAEATARLIADGHDPVVVQATGLGINPLFPASKLAWVILNVPQAAVLHRAGRLRAETVDASLLWNLTQGASFATDHSNASRTQLFDTANLTFSPGLAALFGASVDVLPRPMPSAASLGVTASSATALPAGIPVHAMMVDSHAALYGHGVRAPGMVKATYRTGSSLMTLTPGRVARPTVCPARSPRPTPLAPLIRWSGTSPSRRKQPPAWPGFWVCPAGRPVRSCPDRSRCGRRGFRAALAGLGASHWDDSATGTIPRSIAAGRRPSPRRGTACPPLRSVVMPRQLRGEGVKAIF